MVSWAKIRVLEQESDLKLEDNNRLNSEVNDLREEMVKFEGASDTEEIWNDQR